MTEFLCPHHYKFSSCGNDNKVYHYEGFKQYTDSARHAPYIVVDHCKTCGVKLSEEKAKILAEMDKL
jgi:hypothetical protein